MATHTQLQVDIVSAEAQLFTGEAEMVVVTANLGEVGIVPGHAQLLTALKPGQVRLHRPQAEPEIFYVSGGMLEVQPHKVTILADIALRADDLDEAAALAAKQAAEQSLQHQASEFEYSKALAELTQAVAQLHAIQSLRKKLRV